MEKNYTIVVIGGGVAGMTCVETLGVTDQLWRILLITDSDMVRTTCSAVYLTKNLVEFDVQEVKAKEHLAIYKNIEVLTDKVTKLNYRDKIIETFNGNKIRFEKLCICAGAKPKQSYPNISNILHIRDKQSIVEFQERLKTTRRILIIGNGAIASEIAHEAKFVEKIWVIRNEYMCKPHFHIKDVEFFDFPIKRECIDEKSQDISPKCTTKKTSQENSAVSSTAACGPSWFKKYNLIGAAEMTSLIREYNVNILQIINGNGIWPVRVYLSSGTQYYVDFVVSATGVVPSSEVFKTGNEDLLLAKDGGIIVDSKMETSLPDVFAAGDICTAGWIREKHWLQMRLWNQAKQMGEYSAKCIVASLNKQTIVQDPCFKIFSHVTEFFGYKVIKLGLFKGQKLGKKFDVMLRMTKGKKYAKFILKNARMQGAVLIGKTNLEELCEQFILNQDNLYPHSLDLLSTDFEEKHEYKVEIW